VVREADVRAVLGAQPTPTSLSRERRA
jgi:hypothetical protein